MRCSSASSFCASVMNVQGNMYSQSLVILSYIYFLPLKKMTHGLQLKISDILARYCEVLQPILESKKRKNLRCGKS